MRDPLVELDLLIEAGDHLHDLSEPLQAEGGRSLYLIVGGGKAVAGDAAAGKRARLAEVLGSGDEVLAV